jgi:hypothetical protein
MSAVAYLIDIFLPLANNAGQVFPGEKFAGRVGRVEAQV